MEKRIVMSIKTDSKVAFITGGARGIGRVYAEALGGIGMAIVIADRDAKATKEAVDELTAMGIRSFGVQCDVGQEESVNSAAAEVEAEFGRLDVLINNAALHLMAWSRPVTEISTAAWREILDVNVLGIVNCSRAFRPLMQVAGGGVIVNQSSVSGFTALEVYGITKLAVRGLTTALAKELAGDNIRVYGIAPGPMDSESALADLPPELITKFVNEFQLIKRPGRMQDLVGVLKFFCSDDASFITGETMIVGGGYPLRI
jgi:3-oxoacyl-[acyl-carrier protein] reductase